MPILLPERSNTKENFGLNSLSDVYPHLYYKRWSKNKIILWATAELHLQFLCLLYLVWVIWIFPSYMEHVPNLLSQTNPGSTVGSHIDTGDAMCSSKLWSPQEQHVLLRPKRTYSVCNVIANDNDITAFWILRGLQSHLPGHHPNLQLKSREQKLNAYLQHVKDRNHAGAIFLMCVALRTFSLGTRITAEHSWQDLILSTLTGAHPPLLSSHPRH